VGTRDRSAARMTSSSSVLDRLTGNQRQKHLSPRRYSADENSPDDEFARLVFGKRY
jgi:hypothetical protein